MGFLRRLLGIVSAVEIMRLDLFMEYHVLSGKGSAALEWVPLASKDQRLRPFLVALLYARILGAHAETRDKLFRIIGEVSINNLQDRGFTGFAFPRWMLDVGMGVQIQQIWPWDIMPNPSFLTTPKVYRATMYGTKTMDRLRL